MSELNNCEEDQIMNRAVLASVVAAFVGGFVGFMSSRRRRNK